MHCRWFHLSALLLLFLPAIVFSQEAPISEATQECLDCHGVFHPGIVADWRASRHAVMTPAAALNADDLSPQGIQPDHSPVASNGGRGMRRMPRPAQRQTCRHR